MNYVTTRSGCKVFQRETPAQTSAFEGSIEHNRIYHCDALQFARSLPANSINCVVTSPPYYGLRSYLPDDDPNKSNEVGLEETLEQYIDRMVMLFREVRRVLRDDGTLWLNLGDGYASDTKWGGHSSGKHGYIPGVGGNRRRTNTGLKHKDMMGVPWHVAFALQADGWYLRSDIIWHKPSCMPEPVLDRPTRSHEYVFLLTKSVKYWYDTDAVREPLAETSIERINQPNFKNQGGGEKDYSRGVSHNRSSRGALERLARDPEKGRNRRSVWTVAIEPSPVAHYAMFPQALIEPMILAGCPTGGVVYDPFMGSGTTALVAQRLGRDFIGSEINEASVKIARDRIHYGGDDRRMLDEQAAGVKQTSMFDDHAA